MSSITHDEMVRRWARDLEDRECLRSGVPLGSARAAIARRSGVPAGTLENLRRGRAKGLRGWVRDRIQQLVVREIQEEIKRLEHELGLAVACSVSFENDEIAAARAALAEARKLIGGTK